MRKADHFVASRNAPTTTIASSTTATSIMSAFTVAIGGKAGMTYWGASVRF